MPRHNLWHARQTASLHVTCCRVSNCGNRQSVKFAECLTATLGKIWSLPSALLQHSANLTAACTLTAHWAAGAYGPVGRSGRAVQRRGGTLVPSRSPSSSQPCLKRWTREAVSNIQKPPPTCTRPPLSPWAGPAGSLRLDRCLRASWTGSRPIFF